jgi:hypothetical protein
MGHKKDFKSAIWTGSQIEQYETREVKTITDSGDVVTVKKEVPMVAEDEKGNPLETALHDNYDKYTGLKYRLEQIYNRRVTPDCVRSPSSDSPRGRTKNLLQNKITGFQTYSKDIYDKINQFIEEGPCISITHGSDEYLANLLLKLKQERIIDESDERAIFNRTSEFVWDREWNLTGNAIYYQENGRYLAIGGEFTLFIKADGKKRRIILDALNRYAWSEGEEPIPNSWDEPDIRAYGVDEEKGMIAVEESFYVDENEVSSTIAKKHDIGGTKRPVLICSQLNNFIDREESKLNE